MGSLIKTGEVVKVEPEDIIHLYRYIKKYITLDLKEYLNFLDKAKEDSDFYDDPFYDDLDFDSGSFTPYFFPLYVRFTTNFLLVPKYKYSEIPRILKNNTKVQHRDKIEYEKFSYFDVYRFDNKSDGEIEKVEFEVGFFEVEFILDCFLEKVIISSLKLNIAASESDNKSSNFYDKVPFEDRFCSFYRILPPLTFYEIKRFEEDLRKLRLVQGKSYSKFPEWRRGGVVERIERIEEYMILFTNFLYTLYTGEFEKNTPERRLFERFTAHLSFFGDTFEEVLSTIKWHMTHQW